jgi:pSer/pThr/pTyr-binding forkhead associated (FHA) protein
VSREHARITLQGDTFTIEDLASRNGTKVNGARITGAGHRLVDGDVIEFGDTVELAARVIAGESRLRLATDNRLGEVWVGEVKLQPSLSAAQFGLLALILRADGQVIAHTAIVAAAWPGIDPHEVDRGAVAALLDRVEARLHGAGWTGALGTVTRAGGIRTAGYEEVAAEAA